MGCEEKTQWFSTDTKKQENPILSKNSHLNQYIQKIQNIAIGKLKKTHWNRPRTKIKDPGMNIRCVECDLK